MIPIQSQNWVHQQNLFWGMKNILFCLKATKGAIHKYCYHLTARANYQNWVWSKIQQSDDVIYRYLKSTFWEWCKIQKSHIVISSFMDSPKSSFWECSCVMRDEHDLVFGTYCGMYLKLHKGQIILKCPFGVFKSFKKPTKFFPGFLP